MEVEGEKLKNKQTKKHKKAILFCSEDTREGRWRWKVEKLRIQEESEDTRKNEDARKMDAGIQLAK